VHLKLTPPEDSSPLHLATIKVTSDPVRGVANPLDLALPVRPRNYIVGIRPMVAGGHFTQNSIARFDVVVLDGEGKRRGIEDLSYQIYEQGRSFDW